MPALVDAATFAHDPDVRDPLTAGIVAAAVAIMNESASTAHHGERIMLASQVMRNPEAMAPSFAWAMSINTTVVGKWISGDHDGAIGDFAYVISTVWDAVAGAPAE